MTLCPIAMVVGCKGCPIFKICPVKSIIGDQNKSEKKVMTVKSKTRFKK